MANDDRPVLGLALAIDLFEQGAERVFSYHADDEGQGGIRQCSGRPLNEMGAFVQEDGLHPVLAVLPYSGRQQH